MQGTQRYNWLDVMKLIGIWLMYVTHYDGMGRYGMVGQYTLLGILFFASGFTAFRAEEKTWRNFAKEKFLRLMVPYFVFGVLVLAVRVFLFELTIGEMIQWMKGLLYGARNVCPVAAMWFLPCLFFMELYHETIRRLLKKPALVWICAAVASAAVKLIHEGAVLPWGMDMAARFWIYYAIGDAASLLARSGWLYDNQHKLGWRLTAAVGVALSWYVLYINFYYGLTYFPSLFGVNEPSYFVLSGITFLYECSGIACAFSAALLLQKSKLLCAMGRSTLVLCTTEQLVKILVPPALAAIGLTIPDSGTQVGGNVMAMQAFWMMLASYFVFALPIERYFPWMLGRFKPFSRKEKEKAYSV